MCPEEGRESIPIGQCWRRGTVAKLEIGRKLHFSATATYECKCSEARFVVPQGDKEILNKLLTTTRFHIFAASATVVQTVLHPANSINL
jgi:hypothetical protein